MSAMKNGGVMGGDAQSGMGKDKEQKGGEQYK
jgi:hypothetical protein